MLSAAVVYHMMVDHIYGLCHTPLAKAGHLTTTALSFADIHILLAVAPTAPEFSPAVIRLIDAGY